MYPPHDVHSVNHATERGKALAIGITMATVIELGLIADTNEEFGSCVVDGPTRHRYRTVSMVQARIFRALERS